MGILFGHFPKNCCGHNICEKRVSVIWTFPQPVQVVGWSLDFLSPYWLFLAPRRFSSYSLHFRKASRTPCIGKLTVKCPLCSSTEKPFLLSTVSTLSPEQDAIFISSGNNDVIILALPARSRIAGIEIQCFRIENSSQTNAFSHYSNYSYYGLIPNKRALNVRILLTCCLLSGLASERQWGWRWPCFDTDLTAFVVYISLFLW